MNIHTTPLPPLATIPKSQKDNRGEGKRKSTCVWLLLDFSRVVAPPGGPAGARARAGGLCGIPVHHPRTNIQKSKNHLPCHLPARLSPTYPCATFHASNQNTKKSERRRCHPLTRFCACYASPSCCHPFHPSCREGHNTGREQITKEGSNRGEKGTMAIGTKGLHIYAEITHIGAIIMQNNLNKHIFT